MYASMQPCRQFCIARHYQQIAPRLAYFSKFPAQRLTVWSSVMAEYDPAQPRRQGPRQRANILHARGICEQP
jgi:hypothetical protein